MDERGTDEARRRQRRRATAAQGPAPAAAPAEGAPVPRRRRTSRENGQERGLRDLVGAGPSQLGVSGALRGRDVDRPSEQDLAEAERETVIVRRHWQPDMAENRLRRGP